MPTTTEILHATLAIKSAGIITTWRTNRKGAGDGGRGDQAVDFIKRFVLTVLALMTVAFLYSMFFMGPVIGRCDPKYRIVIGDIGGYGGGRRYNAVTYRPVENGLWELELCYGRTVLISGTFIVTDL